MFNSNIMCCFLYGGIVLRYRIVRYGVSRNIPVPDPSFEGAMGMMYVRNIE